jgi:hypothetical protein
MSRVSMHLPEAGDGLPDGRRPVVEQLALRAPSVAHLGFAALSRVPAGSPLRRRSLGSVVGRFTRMMNRGDVDSALTLAFEPDVEISVVGFAIGTPDHYHGHQGMRDFFADWRVAMGWPHFTIDRVIDMGDPILIGLSFRSRGLSSGAAAAKTGLGFVVSLSQRGLVRSWDMYWHWEEAIRAAAPGRPGSVPAS